MATREIIHDDCVEAMKKMPEASVDAIVCDPPYGLEFMGKEWDRLGGMSRGYHTDAHLKKTPHGRARAEHGGGSYGATDVKAAQAWHEAWAREALRVLKPGGHLLAFGGTRTYHRLACAVEDAGFEIRDSLLWLYGSGFPKSLDVSKAIDKAAGIQREVVGKRTDGRYASGFSDEARRAQGAVAHDYSAGWVGDPAEITAPATAEAERWQGWGTALKPAHEPIVMGRKPLIGTVAKNVQEHGTGGINIDACRIGNDPIQINKLENWSGFGQVKNPDYEPAQSQGRWPANLVLSHAEGCVCIGERRIKAITGGGGTKTPGQHGIYGEHKGHTYEGDLGYADEDGLETIEAWECVEGCPVRVLDEQSGERKAGGKVAGTEPSRTGQNGIYGHWDRVENKPFEDKGGASRFFTTFNHGMEQCEHAPVESSSNHDEPPADIAPSDAVTISRHGDGLPSDSPIHSPEPITSAMLPKSSENGKNDTRQIQSIGSGSSSELQHERLTPSSSHANAAATPKQIDTTTITTDHSISDGSADPVTFRDMRSNAEVGVLDSEPRFKYVAKANRKERNLGLDDFNTTTSHTPMAGRGEPGLKCRNCNRWKVSGNPCNCTEPDWEQSDFERPQIANPHPTVKPIELMRWLVRLVTPPDGTVLDCFLGSGSTGCAAIIEGFNFIGIEREAEYIEIAEARIAFWEKNPEGPGKKKPKPETIMDDQEALF